MLKANKIIAVLLAVVLVLSLCACGGGGGEEPKKPAYPKEIFTTKEKGYSFKEMWLYNESQQRRIWSAEMIPDGIAEGEKVPLILYMHGASGQTPPLKTQAEQLIGDKVAGFLFEACGANSSTPQSDGRGWTNVHISSRTSDLMTAIEYVRTLDYVDQDRIFLYGRSMGGVSVMIAAGFFTEGEFPGIIIESSGLGATWGGMLNVSERSEHVVEEYAITNDQWEDWVVKYPGDVLFVCAEYDIAPYASEDSYPAALYAADVYRRTEGRDVVFCSLPNPESTHTWNSFAEDDKITAINAIRDFVLAR